MRLSAVILDDNVLVLAAEHDGDSSSSLGTNIYDQLSGLINELTVAHREAAKNAKLMRVAMEDERRGREGLEELHDRVRFLANAGQQCAQHASNVEEFVRTVLTLTLAVPVLGDFCTITVAANEITRIAQGRHVDPDLKASLDGALERNVVEEVFRNDYGADVLSFPLITCRPDEARICVGRASSAYTNDERALAEQFANIVSVALDNALLYERQRSISEVLQRALLPTALPGSQAFVMDALRTKQ